jgi:hypothetical protein
MLESNQSITEQFQNISSLDKDTDEEPSKIELQIARFEVKIVLLRHHIKNLIYGICGAIVAGLTFIYFAVSISQEAVLGFTEPQPPQPRSGEATYGPHAGFAFLFVVLIIFAVISGIFVIYLAIKIIIDQ